MFKKVAFTMLPVDDSTRARAFYETALGFKRGLSSPDGVWTEYDLPGGGCLALFKHPDPSMKGGRGTAQASIAFEVEDLDACMADLRAKDVAFTSGIIKAPNCRMANIKDSEGNTISLVSHQPC